MKIALAALLVLPLAAQAAPTGRLAYIQKNAAIVSNLSTGKTKTLPQSARARVLSISPRGETVYFTAPPGQKDNDGPPSLNGYFCAFPYSVARRLPAKLQGEAIGRLTWSRSGTTLWIQGFELNGAYTPATNNWKPLAYLPESVSRDGQRIAYATGDEIRIREVNSGRERVIFNRKQPQVLLTALKNGKNQKNLRDLTQALDPEMRKESIHWALSSPALTPDGSRLFFASNVGTGQGAAGNSSWAIFSADLKTGSIAVLSKLGTQFGRMPDTFEVSPDGKRLLCLVSAHSSAIENPYYALVVDLLTQNSREILQNVPESKGKANFCNGICWSPDGKYVALSTYFYDVSKVSMDDKWEEPSNSAYTLYIKDAATGRTVRRIAGAVSPSWGR